MVRGVGGRGRSRGLTAGVDYLREIGASGVVVTPAYYVFDQDCKAFERLREAVGAEEATA